MFKDVCTMQHTATHCNTLQHTATHCNTPCTAFESSSKDPGDVQRHVHTTTHCNTLQHTATHCNTLQHTATHLVQLSNRVPRIREMFKDLCAQNHFKSAQKEQKKFVGVSFANTEHSEESCVHTISFNLHDNLFQSAKDFFVKESFLKKCLSNCIGILWKKIGAHRTTSSPREHERGRKGLM